MEYTNKGMEAYDSGDYESAVQNLSSSYEIDPSNDRVLYYLASAYRSLPNADKATELYSALVNKFPDSEFVSQAKGYLRNGAEDENAANNNAQNAGNAAQNEAVPEVPAATDQMVPAAGAAQTDLDLLQMMPQE